MLFSKNFLVLAAICSCLGFAASSGLVRWVNVTNDKLLLGNWEPAGVENGANLYLARVYHYDEVSTSWHYLNGKLAIGEEIKASIAINTKGYTYDQFQMLSAPPGALSWVPHPPNSPFPDGAVIGGFLPRYNSSAYVCRTSNPDVDNNTVPGFMWPNHANENRCYFPFQGEERDSVENVEILVINRFGKMTGVVQEEG